MALPKTPVASLLVAVTLLAGSSPAARAELLNDVVLRVNERILTLYDYLAARAEWERTADGFPGVIAVGLGIASEP